jgi:hypothetical protein
MREASCSLLFSVFSVFSVVQFTEPEGPGDRLANGPHGTSMQPTANS